MSEKDSSPTEPKDQEQSNNTETEQKKQLSKEEIDALLDKVRSQERDKVMNRLKEAEEKAKTSSEELDQLRKKLEEQSKKLAELDKKEIETKPEPASAGTGDQKGNSMSDELVDLVNTLKSQVENLRGDLDKAKEDAAKAAEEAKKAALSELNSELSKAEAKSYRERRVKEEGIRLAELVSGSTIEEIDKSIAAVKEREKELFSGVEEELRKDMASKLPSPLHPRVKGEAQSARSDLKSLMRMNREEFEKHKAARLADARKAR